MRFALGTGTPYSFEHVTDGLYGMFCALGVGGIVRNDESHMLHCIVERVEGVILFP